MARRPAPADRGLPDRGPRDRVQGRLHLHPRRVPGRVRDPRRPPSTRRATAGLFGDVEITVHRGAGAYICGEETALLDVARGQARPAAPAAAVPAGAGPLRRADADQQRLHDRDGADDHRARRGRVREDRPGELAGHRDLLDLRQRRAPRQLRARARDADARADLRPRRRDRRRPRAEGGDPRRLIGAGAVARRDRRAARLRLARRDRHVLRRRVADRRRRPLLHGAARPALDEVLHARVVRQVHAVPRGDALDGAAPREDRGGRGGALRPRPARLGRRAHPRQGRSARSATSPSTRSRAT